MYERMIYQRETMAATCTDTGNKDSQLNRNDAERLVTVMIAEAESKSAKLVAEGEAEYMRILSEAYNDSDKADFYKFIISLDAAKTSLVDGKENTLILSADSPIAQMFHGS